MMKDVCLCVFSVTIGGLMMFAYPVSAQNCSWTWVEPTSASLTRSVGAPATFTAFVNDVLSDSNYLTWKSGTTTLSIDEYSGGSFISSANPRSFTTGFQPLNNTGNIYTLNFPAGGVTPADDDGSITVTSQGCATDGTSPAVSLAVSYCNMNFFSSVALPTNQNVECGYKCVREFSCLNTEIAGLSFHVTCQDDATWNETLPSASRMCMMCDEEEYTVMNDQVYHDITEEDCGDLSDYPSGNKTFTVSFGRSPVGTIATANVFCRATCDKSTPGPIGHAFCTASRKYSPPIWVDCSLEDPTTEQRLQTTTIETANSHDVTERTIAAAVEILRTVSTQEKISTAIADEIVAVTNNILRASGENALEQIQMDWNVIMQSLYDMSANVLLNSTDNLRYFTNEQSRIAVGVAQPITTRAALVEPKSESIGGIKVYYGFDGPVSSNLALTGLYLSSKVNLDLPYVSARSQAERITFVVFTNAEQLFPNNQQYEILSNDIVYGVSGPNVSYTMQFPIKSNIDIGVGNANQFNGTSRLNCLKWSENAWLDSGCTDYYAHNGLATCSCVGPGEYTIRSVSMSVSYDLPLTAEATAGIVMGVLFVICATVVVSWCVIQTKSNRKQRGYSRERKSDIQ